MGYARKGGLALTLTWLVSMPGAGCGDSDGGDTGPTPIPLHGVLHIAAGLALDDYEVLGSASDDSVAPDSAGEFTVQVYDTVPGTIFAAPKEGSALTAELPSETGLYAAPYLGGGQRLVVDGTSYAVASDGAAVIDARTTVLDFVMQHMAIASASADVQRQQGEWLAARINAGWPTLSSCADRYDELLVNRADFAEDAELVACLGDLVDEIVTDIPAFEPAPPPEAPAWWVGLGVRRQGVFSQGEHYALSSGGQVVSTVAVTTDSGSRVDLSIGTVNGTGLDYIYEVSPASSAEFPQGPADAAFQTPEVNARHAAGGARAVGTVSASSYFGYLDVVGNLTSWVTSKIGGTIGLAPGGIVELPVPSSGYQYYVVRLFSGGYGVGPQAAVTDYAEQEFPERHATAFRQNVAMAILEVLSLVPGADALLGDDVAGKLIQEATTQAITRLHELLGQSTLTGEAVYNMLYEIARGTVNKYLDEATKGAQVRGVRRLLSWVAAGGKKAAKLVLGLPAKVAKGGSLANRAFRLAVPDSVMEVWLVAVGEGAQLEVISGVNAEEVEDLNHTWTVGLNVRWTLQGSHPEHDTSRGRPYDFWVDGGQPAAIAVSLEDITVEPARVTLESPDQLSKLELITSGARLVGTVDDSFFCFYGPDSSTDLPHSAVFRDDGVDASFTIPSPQAPLDYNHCTVSIGLGIFGERQEWSRADTSSPYELVSSTADTRLDSAGVYLGEDFVIEAR